MGKIVKYCAACEESFAEKFGFCPNCGQPMTAFEMNPVAATPVVEEEIVETAPIVEESNVVKPIFRSSSPTFEKTSTIETADAPVEEIQADETETIADVPVIEDEPKTFAAAAGATNGSGSYQSANTNFHQSFAAPEDDAFHITVIEEQNGKQRNGLLLAATILMVAIVSVSSIYSLFNREFGVGAIGDEGLFALVVVDEVPMDIEEQPKPENDKDAGGGGGGGREEKQPVSKGRLVSQSENPITPPNANIPQLKNPSLPVNMETQGKIKRPITEERPGLLNSDNLDTFSNGNGRGGGQGGGNGPGQGNGNGTGEGNGNGSGSGNGNGNGNGDGTGDGDQGARRPPPLPTKPVVSGVTSKVKIISKPKPGYTNEARQNNVTGTVRLRVVFNASGTIGSVSSVSGLPNGLTEQAIAAAKGIRFEPAMKNGVPITTQSTIEYSFSIY